MPARANAKFAASLSLRTLLSVIASAAWQLRRRWGCHFQCEVVMAPAPSDNRWGKIVTERALRIGSSEQYRKAPPTHRLDPSTGGGGSPRTESEVPKTGLSPTLPRRRASIRGGLPGRRAGRGSGNRIRPSGWRARRRRPRRAPVNPYVHISVSDGGARTRFMVNRWRKSQPASATFWSTAPLPSWRRIPALAPSVPSWIGRGDGSRP